jgi:tetratricopeptide (TPR) repeat protein
MNLLRLALSLILTTALCGSGRAADRSVEDAKRFFYSAQTHFRLGEFEQALHDFQDAYRLRQDPALLFNIAQCYKHLGRLDDSLHSYRSYLRDAGNVPNRETVEKSIAELEQKIAERDRATASPAKPAMSESPRTEPAEVQTPTSVRAPASVKPGVATVVSSPPPRRRRDLLIAGGVVGAVGLGLVGGAIGTASLAANDRDALTALDRARMPFDPALDDSRKTNVAISATLFAVGGAAIVCGSVLLGLGRRGRQ